MLLSNIEISKNQFNYTSPLEAGIQQGAPDDPKSLRNGADGLVAFCHPKFARDPVSKRIIIYFNEIIIFNHI